MLTSGQYAYLLLQKLRILFSIYESNTASATRAYLYSFFQTVFCDDSVVITEENYNNFNELMDIEVNSIAKDNLYTVEQLFDKYNDEKEIARMNEVLGTIGIQVEIRNPNSLNPSLVVTLPSGEQKTLAGLTSGQSRSDRFYSQLRVTDEYYDKMSAFYQLKNIENPIDLKQIGSNFAGFNTFWEYDTDNKALTISGSGVLANSDLWAKYNISSISKLYVGAGVYGYSPGCFSKFISSAKIIDLHGELDEIIFYGDPFTSANSKSATKFIVYSDNLALRNISLASNVQVEWHHLFELEE